MSCVISINTTIVGGNLDSEGHPQTLTVTGTATCDWGEVIVSFVFGSYQANFTAPNVWTLDVDVPANFSLDCGQQYKVEAWCQRPGSDIKECRTSEETIIQCDKQECPTITLEIHEVAKDCVDGKREVTFHVTITGAPDPTVYHWDWGHDGEISSPGVLGSGDHDFYATHPFPVEQEFNATIKIDYPQECSGRSIPVGPLGKCPNGCPGSVCLIVKNESGDIIESTCDEDVELEKPDCLPPGKYTISVRDPPADGYDYSWSVDGELQDGETGREFIYPLSASKEVTISSTVNLDSVDECIMSDSVTLKACFDEKDCPKLTGLQVQGCAPGLVTLTATGEDLDNVEEFYWEFGDETTQITSGNIVEHSYEERRAYTVTVRMKKPNECEPIWEPSWDEDPLTSTVPGCSKDGDDDDNGPPPKRGFGLCGALLAAWFFAFIVAGLAYYLGYFWAIYVFASYVAALAIWIGICCWPCGLRFWKCCELLQWHFIATGWLIQIFAVLTFVGTTNAFVTAIYVGFGGTVIAGISAIGKCRLPNIWVRDDYPKTKCKGNWWSGWWPF